MAHPRWRAGKLSTGFIAEEFKDGFRNPRAAKARARSVLAAVAVAIDHKLGSRKRQISGQLTGRAVTRATTRHVWLDAAEYVVEITDEGATCSSAMASTACTGRGVAYGALSRRRRIAGNTGKAT